MKIKLNQIKDINDFVNLMRSLNFNVYLGPDMVNAKSLMGVYSLDLSKEIEVHPDKGYEEELSKYIDKYLI